VNELKISSNKTVVSYKNEENKFMAFANEGIGHLLFILLILSFVFYFTIILKSKSKSI
jgi:hypothetical protein